MMNGRYSIGTVVLGNWTIRNKLGEGSFGRVYEIQREDFGEVYRAALKVITVPQSESELTAVLEEGMTLIQAEQYFYGVVEDIVREFAIMARLKGTANVVGYEDHTVIRHGNECKWDILIRMELLNPLLPYAYEHPLARRDVIKLGIDMCRALELCQKYNVIHRDIKPENIFVSNNGDFKLGDFGISRTIDRTMAGLSKKGTYNYMAPEVYRGDTYGYSVDIYSLGIVLYRLLNKNRLPFLPPAPETITFQSREAALAKRMSGEVLPVPYYAEGRLCEIVLKACAFNPKDRYASPEQMRRELEAILYDENDAQLIYPDGDELALGENVYASKSVYANDFTEDATQCIFGASLNEKSVEDSGTEYIFGRTEATSKTEYIFSLQESGEKNDKKDTGNSTDSVGEKPGKKSGFAKMTTIIVGILLVMAVGGGVWYCNHQKQVVQEQYVLLMQQGTQLLESDVASAMVCFNDAHELCPEETEPLVFCAYALLLNGEYESCITYIENDLALGKSFEVQVQSRLSEILASAYFELEDYAAAASFFRLSTAGGDIAVSAQRDYAIALGKLGDYDAASEILQGMELAGAGDDITTYVKAEVNFARKQYLDAEQGFLYILNQADDTTLKKRALVGLSQLYQSCAILNRNDESPIDCAATKLVDVLSKGIAQYNLNYDSTLLELLAWGYYEAYQAEAAPETYLEQATQYFGKVLGLGVQKDYIYRNLYAIYYEMKDYVNAEKILEQYQNVFVKDYMPHALHAILLISIESEKEQADRDYTKAVEAYEMAGQLIRNQDDTTYYQQLETLIEQLRSGGWIS